MKIIPFFLMTLTLMAPFSLYPQTLTSDISQKDKPATFKLLLLKDTPKTLLETRGTFHLYHLNGALIEANVPGQKALFYADKKGIFWGEPWPGVSSLRLVPAESTSTCLISGIPYRGCIEIHKTSKGFHFINEIDIESFLKSTLSCELKDRYPEEVWDALCIAARTNAYHLAQKPSQKPWQYEAGQLGYAGVPTHSLHPALEKAIENTRHLILTYDNAPFSTHWTKDSGGKTASYASIFRKNSKTPEPLLLTSTHAEREARKWSFSMAKSALARSCKFPSLTSVDLFREKNSDKVYAIRLKHDKQQKNVDFFTLQKLIGKEKLKSNDFTIQAKGDTLVFTGYGEGHGVGLCLYSAATMAKDGQSTIQILNTFFPGTKIQKSRTLFKKG